MKKEKEAVFIVFFFQRLLTSEEESMPLLQCNQLSCCRIWFVSIKVSRDSSRVPVNEKHFSNSV